MLHDTPANQKKRVRLTAMLHEVLEEVLRHGFHGTAAIELRVCDGVIQQVARRVERIER